MDKPNDPERSAEQLMRERYLHCCTERELTPEERFIKQTRSEMKNIPYTEPVLRRGLLAAYDKMRAMIGLPVQTQISPSVKRMYELYMFQELEHKCLDYMFLLEKSGKDKTQLGVLIDEISHKKAKLSDEAELEHKLEQVKAWENYASLKSETPSDFLKNIVLTIYHAFWHDSRNKSLKKIATDLKDKAGFLGKYETELAQNRKGYIRKRDNDLQTMLEKIGVNRSKLEEEILKLRYDLGHINNYLIDDKELEYRENMLQVKSELQNEIIKLSDCIDEQCSFNEEAYHHQTARKAQSLQRKIAHAGILKRACTAAAENIQNAMKKPRKFVKGLF